MKTEAEKPPGASGAGKQGYNRLLLLVAGLGGLLFGVDIGIISGVLPYLQDTSSLGAQDLSYIVAAVMLGGAISTLFAGMLADLLGRKTMLTLSGAMFVASVPIIALSNGYGTLICGRLLQGISGGLIGVVAPLYLAECLPASDRGKGTGIFQWLLTFGFVATAAVALYFSRQVEAVAKLGDKDKLFAYKDFAWRSTFWVSLLPGVIFVGGSFLVAESPRWLFRQGKKEAARRALLRSRTEAEAEVEYAEMAQAQATEQSGRDAAGRHQETIFQRKYVVPFVLACIILVCNQATGVNSIIGYSTVILIQAGLSDQHAHIGNFLLTVVNFLMTIGAIVLVDRKGRKFLLSLGSAGVIVSLVATGFLFRQSEALRVDVKKAVQAMVVQSNQTVTMDFDATTAARLLGAGTNLTQPRSMVVIYSYGDFDAATKTVRSDDLGAKLTINRAGSIPDTGVAAFFKNPFASLETARTAPLKIQNALITPVPSESHGWLTACFIYGFMAFFAVGPGVCVWLALSELMPTRIRSNGMSVALLINTAISTTIAAIFLPAVGKHGYSTMFFAFAGCTVVYFVTAAFFLPETKGKTLEEIEAHFAGKKNDF